MHGARVGLAPRQRDGRWRCSEDTRHGWLTRYQLPAGPRVLDAQRINGHVAIADVPAHDHRRVYLVERHIESQAAMTGLIAGYLAESARRGEPVAALHAELRVDDRA